MEHNTLSWRPGEQLRELRNKLGVTTREVEEFSRAIAEDCQNEDFYISNAWLTQLENKNSIPSIYKLFSLSAIYRMKFADLLAIFGVDLNTATRYQLALPLQKTHLAAVEPPDPHKAITFPVRFDKSFSLDKTSLISRMVEIWGEVPVELIQRLDLRHCQYGYIGTADFAMYPLLRPGTFVQIDSRPGRPHGAEWRTEFDRPIYFVELRDGYACSWCEVRGSQITLVPHPLSGCGIRQFAYPTEAEIVGQVTAVAMRLVPSPDSFSDELPKLPKRL
ncbi:MAG TPA: helix-turn-helix transcriptional regulator [Candidatus Acidoferrales bacterium]|nr:helix-turn-helix transcriptional regulator [Candidatus Acidoferrales bacterium]